MTPEVGEMFSAEVGFITKKGLGSVNVGNDTISIGPVDCEKGTLVQLRYLGEDDVNSNTTVNYAICLTDHATADNYDDYIGNVVNHLLPDEPPAAREVTYTEIDEIEDGDLGITILGGERIQLGPVSAEPGDIVKIVGARDNCAEILTESARGENYEIRFNILVGRYKALPISKGETFTTAITDIENNDLIGYVGEVPVRFPDGDAAIAQKVDGRITEFSKDKAIGEILKTYDEVARIGDSGHWARMQWLRDQGFDEEPLREFAAKFIGSDREDLPSDDDLLRDSLIGEAMRLGLHEKTKQSDETHPRVHISGFRHWVIHKLATVFGQPDDEEDWFRDVLADRQGPTMVFLGDLLELSNGYYAPGPTRAIMTGESEAALVSGKPTASFLSAGLDVEFRGLSRVVKNTSEAELEAHGIPVHSIEEYIQTDNIETFDETYLNDFIETREAREWMPESDWVAYTGNRSYGFEWDEEPFRVERADGTTLSMWKVPVEYGADEYQLKIESADETQAQMVQVPARYHKQIVLILDKLGGIPRRVEFSQRGEQVQLSCDFAPPRAQMRWLTVIGARWAEFQNGRIHWQLEQQDVSSVKQAFSRLAVAVKDAVNTKATQ